MAGKKEEEKKRLEPLLVTVFGGIWALLKLLFLGAFGALGWVASFLEERSQTGWFGAFVTAFGRVLSWFCSKASAPWWVLRIMFVLSVASTIVATALQWERYNQYVYENQYLREMCEKHSNFANSGRQINCELVMNHAWYVEGPLAIPLAVWWCFQAANSTWWGGVIDWVLDSMGDNSYIILRSIGGFVWKHWKNVLCIFWMSVAVASLCALGLLIYRIKGWWPAKKEGDQEGDEVPAKKVPAQEVPVQEGDEVPAQEVPAKKVPVQEGDETPVRRSRR